MTTYPENWKKHGMNKETTQKELKILYDVESVPEGLTLLKVFELKTETGYLFYSSKKGNAPEVIDPDADVTVVDALNNKITYDLKEKTINFTPNDKSYNGKSTKNEG